MEYSTGGDASDTQSKKKKRFHRHTAHQIQRLEAVFKECPHPDEKSRLQLSRDLGLAPRQIKFWFQNRRTQLKTQHERSDNCALRAENDRIRCENIAIREAIKNVICPSCGIPDDSYFDEHKLRMENIQLKEELDRISSVAAKYIGRPISQLPPVQPIHMSSSFNTFGPSLDLHLFPATSSILSFPCPTLNISDMDKSLMADIAVNAMEELTRLLQTNEPLWTKTDGRDVLNLDTYDQNFATANTSLKNPNIRVEASRDSGVVIMNGLALVDMFMDANKWVEFFPTIVSKATTLEVISCGVTDNPSSTLQLMYEELQVLSPVVPTRQLYFLRFCQQIEQGTWVIVDVSYDIGQEDEHPSVHRLPSGCLIQDMPNGYSKVTWVEHVQVEEKGSVHKLYRDVIHSGMAFGAERWLASLQRLCERYACLMVSANSSRELGGVIPSPEGKKSMMKLGQRMVSNFCASLNPSNGHQWNTISGLDEFEVRATLQKSSNGIVISAASTIWLPLPPQHVFNFFKDERTRPQWDVLSNQNSVQEVAHIANGSHPGNSISVFRAYNTSHNNMLILQESCIDSSGSLIVYSPVDLASINVAMSGEDTIYIPLLPSGFTIWPDGTNWSGGSLVTIVFQILVSNLATSAKMNQESVNTVNSLIGNTIHQIKAALNCSTS